MNLGYNSPEVLVLMYCSSKFSYINEVLMSKGVLLNMKYSKASSFRVRIVHTRDLGSMS